MSKSRRTPRDRNLLRLLAPLVIASVAVSAPPAGATPSTTFWAPSTPALQPYRVMHLTYDTYFGDNALYPTDVGLTMGVLPGKTFQAEAGFDLLYPTVGSAGPVGFPVLLNTKVGAPEDAYFKGSPGWSAGIFGVGFEEDVTDYNILHVMVGRTFPRVGSLSAGAYYGLNADLFRSSTGEEQRAGFMAGWTSQAIDAPVIDRIQLAWDVQSGKNVLGATGGGACFYVTPAVGVLMGPVFFLDEDLQPGRSSWMWSMQLDVDVSLLGVGGR
jgi:hypothetical protein